MKQLLGRKHFDTMLLESETPQPKNRQVLVRVTACGICGTDIELLRSSADYTPLGHEIAGVVEAVGRAVSSIKVGQRVVVEDISMCGRCTACKCGKPELCKDGYTLGGQSGIADYLLVHEAMLNPFDGIDDISACMAEPLAVAIGAVKQANLPDYGSLLVFGAGAIGMFCAAEAKRRGAKQVVMVAGSPRNPEHRLVPSQAMGACDLYYAKEGGYLQRLLDHHGPFDSAIVAAPPPLAADALKALRYGGRVVPVGVSFRGNGKVELDICELIFNKKSIVPFIAEPAQNFPLALSLIQSKAINVNSVITHKLTMDAHAQLHDLYQKDTTVIKAVIAKEEL